MTVSTHHPRINQKPKPPLRLSRHGILLVVALAVGIGLVDEAIATDATGAPVADLILEHLRAANAARSTRASEWQAWQLESQRHELLLRTIDTEIRQLGEQRVQLGRELKALQRDEASETVTLRDTVLRELSNYAAIIIERLDGLRTQMFPGAITPKASPDPKPTKQFAQAIGMLNEAERRATTAAVEIVSGSLDGQPLQVKLLRLGTVAAWWRSLDGESAGTATMVDAVLRLEQATDRATIDAIAKAIAVAQGRSTDRLTHLPLPPRPRSTP